MELALNIKLWFVQLQVEDIRLKSLRFRFNSLYFVTELALNLITELALNLKLWFDQLQVGDKLKSLKISF